MVSGVRKGVLLLGCMLLCVLQVAQAAPHVQAYPNIPWHNNRQPCWDQAARYHGMNPWLLYAIAKVESGHNPAAVSPRNRNGTIDQGLMQINTVHLPRLRRYGIPESALKNACASTYIGAWVLADGFRRYGQSWKAIASYNVGSVDTPRRHAIGLNYAKKVYAAYDMLIKRHIPLKTTQTTHGPLPGQPRLPGQTGQGSPRQYHESILAEDLT